jgi:hypothetical protein
VKRIFYFKVCFVSKCFNLLCRDPVSESRCCVYTKVSSCFLLWSEAKHNLQLSCFIVQIWGPGMQWRLMKNGLSMVLNRNKQLSSTFIL